MPIKPAIDEMDAEMAKIRATRGLSSKIARACGIRRAAVYQWRQVPPQWVQIVSEVTGRKPEELRPDIFKPKKGKARGKVR